MNLPPKYFCRAVKAKNRKKNAKKNKNREIILSNIYSNDIIIYSFMI